MTGLEADTSKGSERERERLKVEETNGWVEAQREPCISMHACMDASSPTYPN